MAFNVKEGTFGYTDMFNGNAGKPVLDLEKPDTDPANPIGFKEVTLIGESGSTHYQKSDGGERILQ